MVWTLARVIYHTIYYILLKHHSIFFADCIEIFPLGWRIEKRTLRQWRIEGDLLYKRFDNEESWKRKESTQCRCKEKYDKYWVVQINWYCVWVNIVSLLLKLQYNITPQPNDSSGWYGIWYRIYHVLQIISIKFLIKL